MSKPISSTDPLELPDLSTHQPLPIGVMNRKGVRHLRRIDIAIKIFATVAVVAFVATIVLLGLAQAEYVHPLPAFYVFSGSVASLLIVTAIDCCHREVAKKYKIDREAYYAVTQPPPKRKNKKKRRNLIKNSRFPLSFFPYVY